MTGSAETAFDGPLPIATGRTVARTLWRMLAGRRLRLVGLLLLFLLEAATAVVFPLIVGSLVDAVAHTSGSVPASFWWQLAALAGAAIAAGILAWAGAIALARLAETVIAELRENYVAAALGLPRRVIETAGTGDVVTRASDDIAQAAETLPNALPRVAISAFTIVIVGVSLTALDPRYLIGFALTLPLYALTLRWYLRTAPAVYAADRAAESVRGQHILGTLTELPTVTAHRLEHRQLTRIRDAAWQTVRWAMRTRIIQNRLFGRGNLTEAIGLFAVLAVGIWLAYTDSATPGDVTAAALLFLRTVAPIAALLFVMDELQSALAALGRIIGVIEQPVEEAAPRSTGSSDGNVTLHDVSFSYDGSTPVLQNISLAIAPGESVALVGATGSGKSTLAALIAGIHPPTAGRIDRSVPAEQIVTVTQESHVFTGTLAENLSLAEPTADHDLLRDALTVVGANQIPAQLPDGLSTLVGHGGHPLTGSAASHLALARALLANPALVVLDEATADADTADTTALDHATRALTKGRTALVIAHRLSQAASCDRIIVMEHGRIIEQGNHDALLLTNGPYATLWAAWSSGTERDEGAV
ncbi:MAG: ABC transporter ATP-binding protein/permease [Brachybacterium sp.]|nr:ABC transporter ATP-binding protein/permease [Brachybacterium sp.]